MQMNMMSSKLGEQWKISMLFVFWKYYHNLLQFVKGHYCESIIMYTLFWTFWIKESGMHQYGMIL